MAHFYFHADQLCYQPKPIQYQDFHVFAVPADTRCHDSTQLYQNWISLAAKDMYRLFNDKYEQ